MVIDMNSFLEIKIEPQNFRESNKVIFINEETKKKLKLKKIFGNKKPVKIELCSGHGDWIVERAQNDPDTNWVIFSFDFNNFQI